MTSHSNNLPDLVNIQDIESAGIKARRGQGSLAIFLFIIIMIFTVAATTDEKVVVKPVDNTVRVFPKWKYPALPKDGFKDNIRGEN